LTDALHLLGLIKPFLEFLKEVLEGILLRLQQQQAQQSLPPPRILEMPIEPETSPVGLQLDYGSPLAKPYVPKLDEALALLVKDPALVLIFGHRGSGKSALAGWLQELLREWPLPTR